MLKTGYEELDKVIGGLEKGELITLAGCPGIGKSTLALNIINNVFKQTNDKILYFNFETSKDHLKKKIASNNVEIIDTPNITVEEIKNKCEEFVKSNLCLVVIDYIQLVRPTTDDNLVLKDIEHTLQILKEVARELNIPILILSQLSEHQMENEEEVYSSHFDLIDFDIKVVDKVIILYGENNYKFKDNSTCIKNNDNYFKDIKVLEDNVVMAITKMIN